MPLPKAKSFRRATCMLFLPFTAGTAAMISSPIVLGGWRVLTAMIPAHAVCSDCAPPNRPPAAARAPSRPAACPGGRLQRPALTKPRSGPDTGQRTTASGHDRSRSRRTAVPAAWPQLPPSCRSSGRRRPREMRAPTGVTGDDHQQGPHECSQGVTLNGRIMSLSSCSTL